MWPEIVRECEVPQKMIEEIRSNRDCKLKCVCKVNIFFFLYLTHFNLQSRTDKNLFDIISYSLCFLLTDTLVSRMSAANGQLNYCLALLLAQLQPLRVLSAF